MNNGNKNNEDIDFSKAFTNDGKRTLSGSDASHRYFSKTTGMIRWVMQNSNGIITTKRQANFVLIGFVILMIIAIFVIIITSNEGGVELIPPSAT